MLTETNLYSVNTARIDLLIDASCIIHTIDRLCVFVFVCNICLMFDVENVRKKVDVWGCQEMPWKQINIDPRRDPVDKRWCWSDNDLTNTRVTLSSFLYASGFCFNVLLIYTEWVKSWANSKLWRSSICNVLNLIELEDDSWCWVFWSKVGWKKSVDEIFF